MKRYAMSLVRYAIRVWETLLKEYLTHDLCLVSPKFFRFFLIFLRKHGIIKLIYDYH